MRELLLSRSIVLYFDTDVGKIYILIKIAKIFLCVEGSSAFSLGSWSWLHSAEPNLTLLVLVAGRRSCYPCLHRGSHFHGKVPPFLTQLQVMFARRLVQSCSALVKPAICRRVAANVTRNASTLTTAADNALPAETGLPFTFSTHSKLLSECEATVRFNPKNNIYSC